MSFGELPEHVVLAVHQAFGSLFDLGPANRSHGAIDERLYVRLDLDLVRSLFEAGFLKTHFTLASSHSSAPGVAFHIALFSWA